MPFKVEQKYRQIKRYRQIVAVLVKYGFSDLVERLKLGGYLQRGRALFRMKAEVEAASTAVRIRHAFEELGPTFVKFGQVLSTRSFLVPAEWVTEFAQLQDKVRPESFQALRPILEEELDAPLERRFLEFDETPLASASVAQVHRARTLEGDEVVVKIRRPQIERLIETDMEILHDFARLLEKYLPESRRFNPVGLVEELARSTRRELDFMNEARSIELFGDNFQGYEGVHVVKVFWEYTTSKVLTLEFVRGVKISDSEALAERGIDAQELAQRGTRFILKQVFEDGFFHADPHPGNLLITEGGVIAPVDFGIMGRLDDVALEQFSDILIAVTQRDVVVILRVMEDMGVIDASTDEARLRGELSEFIGRYYGVSLGKLRMKTIVNEVLELMNRHRLRVPSNILLLAKTLGAYEDLAEKLYPEFDFSREVKPYIVKLIVRRLDIGRLAYQGIKTLHDFYKLFSHLPHEVESLLGRLKTGRMSFELRHHGLDNFIREMDRSINRLSFSLIIAALIIGSSFIVKAQFGPSAFGYSILGLAGYLFAGVLGVLLVVAILRSGRM